MALTKQAKIMFTPEDHEALTAEANRQNVSLSALLRTLVKRSFSVRPQFLSRNIFLTK